MAPIHANGIAWPAAPASAPAIAAIESVSPPSAIARVTASSYEAAPANAHNAAGTDSRASTPWPSALSEASGVASARATAPQTRSCSSLSCAAAQATLARASRPPAHGMKRDSDRDCGADRQRVAVSHARARRASTTTTSADAARCRGIPADRFPSAIHWRRAPIGLPKVCAADRTDRRCYARNRRGSNNGIGAAEPVTRSRTSSPIAGASLKPWPENPNARMTRGISGWGPITKLSSGVLVYMQTRRSTIPASRSISATSLAPGRIANRAAT